MSLSPPLKKSYNERVDKKNMMALMVEKIFLNVDSIFLMESYSYKTWKSDHGPLCSLMHKTCTCPGYSVLLQVALGVPISRKASLTLPHELTSQISPVPR